MSETADFSSDIEWNQHYPSESSLARSRKTSSVYSIPESSPKVIVILDSDDEEDENPKNLVVNFVVKVEQKPKLEDLPQAIKREDLLFFLRLLECQWFMV
jgi:hypothetical protein